MGMERIKGRKEMSGILKNDGKERDEWEWKGLWGEEG